MSRAFNPASWVDGVTIAHASDFQHIATDLYTRGDNVDSGGYGLANTGSVGLIPGALPGTTYIVTGATWSGGVATVTVGGHVIGVNQLVTVAGVTPSSWNAGPVKVTAVTSTTFSFALAANPGSYVSGGTVVVGAVPGLGTIAANQSNQLQIYTGSSWTAATTAVAAGTWLAGAGAPSGGTGSNGDMYLNTSNGDVYGPKTGGAWGASSINIKGPTGTAGAGYGGTSVTSITLATGAKVFTTQANLAYGVGARVRASSAATPGRYMEGLITAYSGTSLTINVDTTGTAGTAADWSFNIAGNVGASGAGSGDMLAATYDPAAVAGQLLKDSGTNGVLTRNGAGITAQAGADHLSSPVYAADTSVSANTITAALSPAIVAYTAGVRYRIKVANAVSGATTVNINGLGAKTVKKWSAGSLVDLASGDVAAGQILDLTYDGTVMQELGIVTAAGGGSQTPLAQNVDAAGFNLTHVAKVGAGGVTSPNTSIDTDGALCTRQTAITLANGANNNVNIGNASFVRSASPTGTHNITGFNGGFDGRVLRFYNNTLTSLTIKNQNAGSSAANQIVTCTGSDVTLRTGLSFASFIYDSNASLWIMTSSN